MHPITAKERAKYADVWQLSAYKNDSPGANFVTMFERMVRPIEQATIIDVGCGAGAATRILKDGGYRVWAFDLTDTAFSVPGVHLFTGSIWSDLIDCGVYDHAYCCDVMEHIPTEYVGLALTRILESCRSAFFSISFEPDHFGRYVGQPLHLTVRPFTWWCDIFRELGTLHDARDLLHQGLFHASL